MQFLNLKKHIKCGIIYDYKILMGGELKRNVRPLPFVLRAITGNMRPVPLTAFAAAVWKRI